MAAFAKVTRLDEYLKLEVEMCTEVDEAVTLFGLGGVLNKAAEISALHVLNH